MTAHVCWWLTIVVGEVLGTVEQLRKTALMHWFSKVSSTGEDGLPNPGWFCRFTST